MSATSVGRRQRVDNDDARDEDQRKPQQPATTIVSKELVSAVKGQMVPLQHRSDQVDVRGCILGMKECQIVAALLGARAPDLLVRIVAAAPPSALRGKKESKASSNKKEDDVAENESAEKQQQQPPAADQLISVHPFFSRVSLMRLQLGAHVAGGLGLVLSAARLHSATLRRLDLSRNHLTANDASLVSELIAKCENLEILCLSHNVKLRSAGVAAICETAGKLPYLRALLLMKCSVDSFGAISIAQLLASGQLPVMSQQRRAGPQQAFNDYDDVNGGNNAAVPPSVQLTIDLSHNRIGAAGLIALRTALPSWVGLGAEKQSPPLQPEQQGNTEQKKRKRRHVPKGSNNKSTSNNDKNKKKAK